MLSVVAGLISDAKLRRSDRAMFIAALSLDYGFGSLVGAPGSIASQGINMAITCSFDSGYDHTER